ncbi:MAG: hypothetical protein AB8B96_03355 [Lysobacterales bacterium]
MKRSSIKRSTKLIAAVLGGQTLALSIMLSAAWMLSAIGSTNANVHPSAGDCVVVAASQTVTPDSSPAKASAPRVQSRKLLDLSVGWLR